MQQSADDKKRKCAKVSLKGRYCSNIQTPRVEGARLTGTIRTLTPATGRCTLCTAVYVVCPCGVAIVSPANGGLLLRTCSPHSASRQRRHPGSGCNRIRDDLTLVKTRGVAAAQGQEKIWLKFLFFYLDSNQKHTKKKNHLSVSVKVTDRICEARRHRRAAVLSVGGGGCWCRG